MCQRRNYEARSAPPDTETYLGGNKSNAAKVRMGQTEREKKERKRKIRV